MKYLSLLTLSLAFMFTSCGDETELPICIESIYDDFREDACSGDDFTIWRFRGEDVYCFQFASCGNNFGAEIYNANCEQLCVLGLAGNTECQGLDWESNATLLETIYVQP